MTQYILIGLSTRRGKLLGFLTRFFTRWRHSHVVLIREDEKVILEAAEKVGVREMPIGYLLGRDDVEIRKIPHPAPQAVWDHAKTLEGVTDYDELYSLGWLVNNPSLQDSTKMACVELIAWACRKAGKDIFHGFDGMLAPRDYYLISEPM